jgi:hypothetical protein
MTEAHRGALLWSCLSEIGCTGTICNDGGVSVLTLARGDREARCAIGERGAVEEEEMPHVYLVALLLCARHVLEVPDGIPVPLFVASALHRQRARGTNFS